MKNSEINKESIFEKLDTFLTDPNFRKELGKNWYQDQKSQIFNNVVLALPLKGLISLKVYLAVVAILSPANKWNNNLWDAYFLILDHFGIELLGINKYKFYTYGANVDKARLLLKRITLLGWSENLAIETALKVPTSLKTWNFYNNLLDSSNNEFLTVDRHILSVCGFEVNPISPANYRAIEAILKDYFEQREVFKEYSLAQFQAVLWCNWLNQQGKPWA
jgi:hypothetical protein